jgi:hypothetical protein
MFGVSRSSFTAAELSGCQVTALIVGVRLEREWY